MVLPRPLGPYHVSFADFELNKSKHFEFFSRDGNERKDTFTPLFRIFYPTTVPHKKFFLNGRQWFPSVEYIFGQLRMIIPPSSVLKRAMIWMISWIIYVFLYPFMSIQASVSKPVILTAGKHSAAEEDERLPVVIFSHGLWSMRTSYSTFCCDLASYGYVVVALEHFDGSASAARQYDVDGACEWKYFQPLLKNVDAVPVEYRHTQLTQRVEEIESLFSLLNALNEGKVSKKSNMVRGNVGLRIDFLVNRLDLESVAIAGHSFGAITSILYSKRKSKSKLESKSNPELESETESMMETKAEPASKIESKSETKSESTSKSKSEFESETKSKSMMGVKVKCCLALDPWWTPLPEDAYDQELENLSLLCIDSENFGGPILKICREKFFSARKNNKCNVKTEHYAIKGSTHQDQSDFPLMFPKLMKKIGMSGTLGGNNVRKINSKLCLRFLSENFLPKDHSLSYEISFSEQESSNVIKRH